MNARTILLAAAIASASQTAQADINIGVIASLTGPAAILGTDIKRAVALMPDSIDGEKIHYTVLDDASDPTTAVKNAHKLISERNVDAIIGPNTNPTAAAATPAASDSKTPIVIITPYIPPKDKRAWVFQSTQSVGLMAQCIVEDMVARGAKTVGYIGFADSLGDIWYSELLKAVSAAGITVIADERYARSDTSVAAQTLKLLTAKPDVVLVGASGTPAALPPIELRQRGYKGNIYYTHGVTSKDFLRIGGKQVEGALIPVGPVLVADQLPDTRLSKKTGVDFNNAYETKYGPGSRSTFAGSTWDAWLLLANAIPPALKSAKPGTPGFRQALRDNLERTRELPGVNGVYNMTPQDHIGLDHRGRVLVEVRHGQWKYIGAEAERRTIATSK
ncbi:MAG TPA: ABC transporter substrate-binding protein [Eoetvoesiella sp.]|uniref:ABC transporter substrate-binding protein n=1 Tax=Eoetvoesiella sp. TaxID=1966355 RepID=UPI002C0E3B22|nr:ABC transporter substrate-binding protein [Eoetvoesiella sp.]HWK60254.1 ABC transporter substrate-binding protein [Eoetvoesiella sp.]